MNRIALIFLFLALLSCSSRKINIDPNNEVKVYSNLEKALKKKREVYALDLSNQELKNFPVTIFELENLKVLIIVNNEISEIPKEIGRLENLQILELLGNNISTIPKEIKSLKNLKKLNLVYNPIQDSDFSFLKESLPNCRIFLYPN